jgi:DNA-binding MarR family transcriptional regulator
MNHDQLKLENQLCFPLYALSRLITRAYQSDLDELGITYPQYLVLLVLWENDNLSVNEIGAKLILNTNTITPLLKRMETLELVTRTQSKTDQRKVLVQLTDNGWAMKLKASEIPQRLMNKLNINTNEATVNKLFELKDHLYELIQLFELSEQKEF